MVSKPLALAAILFSSLSTPLAADCWQDGRAAGKAIARLYCDAIKDAYNYSELPLHNVNEISLCGGGSQGLSCKQAMGEWVEVDQQCNRLYTLNWAGEPLDKMGYTARSLFDLYAYSCLDQSPVD